MRLKAISLFVIASFFVVRSGSSAPASVQSMPTSVEITFELNAKVRFCYDKDPEIIYFRHDASSNRTIVEARSLDNRTRALFDFPGLANPRSLSCSIDGSTIAALSGDNGHLYIFQSSQLLAYEIQRPTLDNVKGFYSLLSPDGKMIGLYGDPVHRSGADAIANMKMFKVARGDSVFFDEDAAYVDEEHEIARYQYLDGGWGRQGSISKPLDYSVIEVSRCGNRLVASLSDDEHLGLLDPEKREAGRDDWLKRVGVRTLLKNYSDQIEIDGSYRQCVMPLFRKRDFRKRLAGIVTFNHEAMQRFAVGGEEFVIDDKIDISKDGCLALFLAFEGHPEIPQSTMTQRTVVLRLGKPGCARYRDR
jgi:hypothetical protein